MATRDLDELLPTTSVRAAPIAPVPVGEGQGAVRRTPRHGTESGGWVLWASVAAVAGGAALWYYSTTKRGRERQRRQAQTNSEPAFQRAVIKAPEPAAERVEQEEVKAEPVVVAEATAWDALVAQAQGA